MFKIEIVSDDGRKLQISKEDFICFKRSNGEETYCEWEHIKGRSEEFEQIFTGARSLMDRTQDLLPEAPMSALR